jgi:hypothetical protein
MGSLFKMGWRGYFCGLPRSFCPSGPNFGQQAALGDDQIDQSKQGVQVGRVFGQAPVAGLAVAKDVFQDVKGMLDPGPDAGFEPLGLLREFFERALDHGFDFAPFGRNVPLHLRVVGRDFLPLFHADVTRVDVSFRFLPVEHGVGLGDVGHMGRRAREAMHQPRLRVRTDVRFHAEIPLVALPGLVHCGVALPVGILGRGRGVDDGGVDHRAFAHEQAALRQKRPHFLENPPGQLMALQQMAELEQRRGVGHRLAAQINPGKRAHGLAVVDRVFQRLVSQRVPLLQKVEAQHPLDPDGRTPPLAQRIVRLDQGRQPRPRHHLFHFSEKLLPPRGLFLPGIFRLRKTHLLFHAPLYQRHFRQPIGFLKSFD